MPDHRRDSPKVRLYIDAALKGDAVIDATPAQSHYLRRVMRLGAGDEIGVFNADDGEWSADLAPEGRNRCRLRIAGQLRAAVSEPDLWLLFAPVKRLRLDILAEKATELGAARLQPVRTEFTIANRVNIDRLHGNAVAAAEQSGRLSVPDIAGLTDLAALCRDWPSDRRLFWADEAGGGAAAPVAFAAAAGQPAAVLIGPEGGLGPADRTLLNSLSNACAIDLGPRILRSETAALAALTLWQAMAGDGRERERAGAVS